MMDVIYINGVKVSVDLAIAVIGTLTHPDPKMWYRFERDGDMVKCERKREE